MHFTFDPNAEWFTLSAEEEKKILLWSKWKEKKNGKLFNDFGKLPNFYDYKH